MSAGKKNMRDNEIEDDGIKSQTVKEIGKIMVENMKANMENPNIFKEKKDISQKILDDILKKRKERQNK